jgi:hypothetical protein
MMKKTIAATALALAAMLPLAGEAAEGQGFVQVQVGRSDASASIDGLGSASDKDTALALRGGFYLTDNFGGEVFAAKLYDEDFDGASLRARAVGVGLFAKHNFGTDGAGFFVTGRAGMARGTIDGCVDDVGCDDASSTEPYFGVGLGYDINPRFGLGIGFDRFRGDGDGVEVDVDVLSIGAELRW